MVNRADNGGQKGLATAHSSKGLAPSGVQEQRSWSGNQRQSLSRSWMHFCNQL